MGYKENDRMIQIALANFEILGHKDKKIKIFGFNEYNNSHLALLKIAQMAGKFFEYNIYINCNIFKYIKYKIFYYNSFKKIKLYNGEKDRPSFNEMINYMETNENNNGIFNKIYEEYYK